MRRVHIVDLGTTLSVLRLSWIPVNQGRRKTRVCEFSFIFHILGSVQQDLPVPDQSQLKVTKVEETPKVSQESEVDLSNKKQSWRAPQKLF